MENLYHGTNDTHAWHKKEGRTVNKRTPFGHRLIAVKMTRIFGDITIIVYLCPTFAAELLTTFSMFDKYLLGNERHWGEQTDRILNGDVIPTIGPEFLASDPNKNQGG